MEQYRFFINYNFAGMLLGFTYDKHSAFCLYILWFRFGIGLMKGAKGFGIWRA